ncbi:uncharacterized protein PITG_10179 [Phytophthora infestans T30-4]|uniref:Uncharacterized protein n=1 Tax=Phytophthora infestans (strain T30-4) TaxID=403677 RepID=D0NEI5_PHYIT|nr:uncharacterized protein PITG_10179 [Phytophthora infestans T30-4]EEY56630.1 conserved hypothetical protein [Phytophthora infestans T30-4]|eukprot:XP_002902704.1 conserved hypothetical protein [Phytophthora infestans T30-4]
MADAGGEAGAGERPVPSTGDFDTYAKELGRWAVNDYSGLREPLTSKSGVTRTVPLNSLDNAWTSFVSRWNTEGAAKFVPSLERLEADHEERSVSALARRNHNVAYDADRGCCYVHYASGCTWCSESGRPRPGQGAREQEVAEYPVSEAERKLVGQYHRAMSDVRHGGRPRHPEDLPPLERLPRTPPHSPERPREAPLEAPSYRPLYQANARDTGSAEGWKRHGRETHDPYAYALSTRGQGRHARTVQRGQREEAEIARSRQRAVERLSRLEREMAELRRELKEPPRPERKHHNRWEAEARV